MLNEISTLFVVKEEEEYCILFDKDDPVSLFGALLEQAERPDLAITREEVFELIEDLVPVRLRAI